MPRDEPSGVLFLAVAVGVAVVVAVAANWVLATLLGLDIQWWVSIGTAAVVGLFIASALFGRRKPKKPQVEGPFEVDEPDR